jgi:hypothetical protein
MFQKKNLWEFYTCTVSLTKSLALGKGEQFTKEKRKATIIIIIFAGVSVYHNKNKNNIKK